MSISLKDGFPPKGGSRKDGPLLAHLTGREVETLNDRMPEYAGIHERRDRRRRASDKVTSELVAECRRRGLL